MNRQRIAGALKELAGRVKQQWAALTGNEYMMSAGKRDEIAGRMQKMYGLASDGAARQLRDWRRRMTTHQIFSQDAPP
ncbi:MAG TPA: CsbD family protein, partial [Burkholderiales bacterium]|nr:CsbD family protein [Burkholderiales bacterium]